MKVYSVQDNFLKTQLSRGFQKYDIYIDTVIRAYPEVALDIITRKEIMTARYKEGHVRIPQVKNNRIPWKMTFPNSDYEMDLGHLVIGGLIVQRADEFEDRFARLDVYDSADEMILDFQHIYGTRIPGDHPISGYLITGVERL